MNLPIAIWMMRSFLMEVPFEIVEAARLDGRRLVVDLHRVHHSLARHHGCDAAVPDCRSLDDA
jgi:hypothetical protein